MESHHMSGNLSEEKGSTQECEILETACTIAGSDPFGQITEAFLLVKGLLYQTVFQGMNAIASTCHPPLAFNESEHFYPDFDYTEDGTSYTITTGTQLFCFILLSHVSTSAGDDDWMGNIVLQRVGECDGTEGVFERVGLMEYERFTCDKQTPTRFEELKGRGGDGVGIVVDAVVKIV
ncbi:hypothetical protein CC86DRAFT_158770 [Ophiobolus disseminans]|uniref:Uncharacterized protein n=1 Tax=Ophiobolus disseminans TaxID=1469910 RepID=A0A6A6ZBC7_9PLEO|nr:hypothetical protein CC86DRAFT_158770 [Ophiobolus disseminans]